MCLEMWDCEPWEVSHKAAVCRNGGWDGLACGGTEREMELYGGRAKALAVVDNGIHVRLRRWWDDIGWEWWHTVGVGVW